MRVAVIGAGVIGVTTAWELLEDGHEVTVFERASAAAEGTSFANAGVVAPGYVTPWAAPGMPAKVLRMMWQAHSPVRLCWPVSAAELGWMGRFWRASRPDVYAANRRRLQRLAFYSQQRLRLITQRLHLQYDRGDGYMVLLRTLAEAKAVEPGLAVLREAGTVHLQLTADAARRVEPALNPDQPLFGAIHLPHDEVGNCRQFTLLLKSAARAAGVAFRFQTRVIRLEPGHPIRLTVQANDAQGAPDESAPFDAVVLCAGTDSAALLAACGVRLPLIGVHGYSVSAPIAEGMNAPISAVMDERFKVAISRLGQRVRVAGSADIGGRAGERRPAALHTLYKVLGDWFPGAVRRDAVWQEWKGARPMLPDGPPVMGASGLPGLWLNLGHGSSGWALACGSARALADQLTGRDPGVDLEGLDIQRLRAH
jgi:D-amino-acid dehydrogenase